MGSINAQVKIVSYAGGFLQEQVSNNIMIQSPNSKVHNNGGDNLLPSHINNPKKKNSCITNNVDQQK